MLLCSKYVSRGALGLVCALFVLLGLTKASAQVSSQPPSVDAIREALDKARFEEAAHLANALLAEPSARARERNDTLELLAIVQIAQRNGDLASETLKLLFDRDAEHPQRAHDPGPAVDAAIARARRSVRSPVTVTVDARTKRDAYGREQLELNLRAGADVVDALHVFAKAERDPSYTEVVHHPHAREIVTVLMPAAPFGASKYKWYVEARAPSGLVLARVADANAPLESALLMRGNEQAAICAPARAVEPVRRRWWLWTSVGVAIAGVAVASAIAVQ